MSSRHAGRGRGCDGQCASDHLKDSAGWLGEIEQELNVSVCAARQVVNAPASGKVIGLNFSYRGIVMGAGEPIAEIVPTEEGTTQTAPQYLVAPIASTLRKAGRQW